MDYQDIKQKIKACRDVLVGVIPSPEAQVQQITIALIYKFMDDMDKEAQEKHNAQPMFFAGEYAQYAWSRLLSPQLGNYDKLNLYAEAIEKMNQNKGIPTLFRDIFKGAFLPYRNPDVLGLFLKEINGFQYDHSENLGNAFEHLLSVMGSQGDAGQFRTPRHIIDFMVKVVDPTKDDTVCDPACGSAGFLISAYKHIIKKHDGKDDPVHKEKQLTPEERKQLMNHFVGYDISPDMVRLSKVNMYLHGFPNPTIYEYDTLSNEDKWDETFNVMLANPPFMTPKGGIKPHKRFSVQANRSEVLFVDYILEHLRPNGRAGIIVPEGIIFQSANAYKQLRKLLVEDGLIAVVSLPSGVFNPYAGVKTSILLFDKELAKRTTDLMFVKISNDGFDLGAQRRDIDKNDLPKAAELISRYKLSLKNGIKFELSDEEKLSASLVTRGKVAETGDYNLSGDRYIETQMSGNLNIPRVELGELCDIYNGSTPSRTNSDYWDNGDIPWFTIDDIRRQGKVIKNTAQFVTKRALNETSVKLLPPKALLLCCTASVGEYAITDIPLTTNQQFNGLVIKSNYKDRLTPDYLFAIAGTFKEELIRLSGKTSFNFLSVSSLKKIKIPLPLIEVQKKIVEQIDKFQKIIDGASLVVNNYQPAIDYDSRWSNVKLGSVCKFEGGTQPPKSTFSDNPKDGYIRMLQIRDYKSNKNAVYIPVKERHKTCTDEDIMIGRYGPPVFQILRGKAGAYNVALMKCLPDHKKLTNSWLFYFLKSSPVQQKIIGLSQRIRQSGVRPDDLNELLIPLPPIEIQDGITRQIEEQEKIIQLNNNLIQAMKEKIDRIILEI